MKGKEMTDRNKAYCYADEIWFFDLRTSCTSLLHVEEFSEMSMREQLQAKEIERLNARLDQAHRMIWELIGALDCKNEAIIGLVRDTADEYMRAVRQNSAPLV